MQRYGIVLFFALLVSSSIKALDFVDASLDGFMKRIVAQDDHKEFKLYYKDFIIKMDALGKSAPTKKDSELKKIRTLAFCSLENMHPDWALQLKPYALYEKGTQGIDTKTLHSARVFLTRYGTYDEFLKNKAQAHAGMWYRFKSYSKHVSNKVTGWFTSLNPFKKA